MMQAPVTVCFSACNFPPGLVAPVTVCLSAFTSQPGLVATDSVRAAGSAQSHDRQANGPTSSLASTA